MIAKIHLTCVSVKRKKQRRKKVTVSLPSILDGKLLVRREAVRRGIEKGFEKLEGSSAPNLMSLTWVTSVGPLSALLGVSQSRGFRLLSAQLH